MVEPFRAWEDIYMVGSSELSHPCDCYVYLLDASDLVLIDCGTGESFHRLVSNIERLSFHPEITADILCEGHFGIYQPAAVVEEYVRGHLDNLQRRWLPNEGKSGKLL